MNMVIQRDDTELYKSILNYTFFIYAYASIVILPAYYCNCTAYIMIRIICKTRYFFNSFIKDSLTAPF